MRRPLSYLLLTLCTAGVSAQVVAPVEISDTGLRSLQQGAMPQLKQIAKAATAHKFDFNFYFTRKLDIDERQQKSTDQHSIRFEHYDGETVLAISGNYFCAYPTSKFNEAQRARRTFISVVLPLAKASVPILSDDTDIQGFAFEVSHHVIGSAMGLPVERPENLMVYLPRAAAIKLVNATDRAAQQDALLSSKVFLNGVQHELWLADEEVPQQTEVEIPKSATAKPASLKAYPDTRVPVTTLPDAPGTTVVTRAEPTKLPITPTVSIVTPVFVPPHQGANSTETDAPRDASPEILAKLQSANQSISNHLMKELGAQAHFITYAPPAFIVFRNQAYLELSLSTTLPENAGTSRYRLAALTFDEQIAPLVRRVMTYFPTQSDFDGISFSYTVQTKSKAGLHPSPPISIEYFFPLSIMRRYDSFDLTGQQLLDTGIILINGERVGVDLQLAEGDGRF